MKKKIALLLAIIMIVSSMPLTAFAAEEQSVYGNFYAAKYYETDSSFQNVNYDNIIDGSKVTHLFIENNTDNWGNPIPLTLEDKNNLKYVEVGNNNYAIPYGAFWGFKNLKEVKLNNIYSIDDFAFSDTAIEEITIPSTVENIEPEAFSNMPNLRVIHNESANSFLVLVCGLICIVEPNSDFLIDLALKKDVHFLDTNAPSVDIQLEANKVNPNEDVEFILKTSPNNAHLDYSLTPDGRLTGKTGKHSAFGTALNVLLKTSTTEVTCQMHLVFDDLTAKSSVLIGDKYNKDLQLKSGVLGNNVAPITQDYIFEIDDSKNPIIFSHLEYFDTNEPTPVPYYTYKNKVVINRIGLFDDNPIMVNVNTGYLPSDYDSFPNLTEIKTMPSTINATLDTNDSKFTDYVQAPTLYSDFYKVKIKPHEGAKINLSDTNKYTNLIMQGIYTYIVNGVSKKDTTVYINNNNYETTGEEFVAYNMSDYVCEFYFVVMQADKSTLPSNYQLELTSYNYINDFPNSPTVTEPLDFKLNQDSVTNAQGKYSWDNTTKTLTLEDGFYISCDYVPSTKAAIALPYDAKIVVNGNAYITCDGDGLYFYDQEPSSNHSSIILNKNSNLKIVASSNGIVYNSSDLDIIGTPNKNGNLPKLSITSYVESIKGTLSSTANARTDNKKLSFKNIDLKIYTSYIGINIENGGLYADNSIIDIVSKSNGIVLDKLSGYNKLDETPNYGIQLNNSSFNISSFDESIITNTGGISLKNCNTKINTSKNSNGIFINSHGDLNVQGGKLNILSNDNSCIYISKDKAIINDCEIALKTEYINNAIKSLIIAKSGIEIAGNFKLYDDDGNRIYKGTIDNLVMKESGKYIIKHFNDYGNEIIPTSLVPDALKPIDKHITDLNGLKSEYQNGESIIIDLLYNDAEHKLGDRRYKPVSWEIVGTEFKGDFLKDEFLKEIPTNNLASGEYTLNVTFELQEKDAQGWHSVKMASGKATTLVSSHNFTILQKIAIDNSVSNSNSTELPKSPQTGIDYTIIFISIIMLSFATTLFITIKKAKKSNR